MVINNERFLWKSYTENQQLKLKKLMGVCDC